MRDDIKVVDFFCGIGGLTHGLRKAKINGKARLNVVAGVELVLKENLLIKSQYEMQ